MRKNLSAASSAKIFKEKLLFEVMTFSIPAFFNFNGTDITVIETPQHSSAHFMNYNHPKGER